jgi:hypothetical protein
MLIAKSSSRNLSSAKVDALKNVFLLARCFSSGSKEEKKMFFGG